MKLKRLFWLIPVLALSWLVVSCASTSKAPESKSSEAKSFNAPVDKGTVYLYRTGRAVGAAGQLSVKVNTQDAGGTGPGTFFKWDLKPGTYTFASSTGESSAVVQLDVKAGQVYYLRQDARLGVGSGRVTIKEVDATKGQDEVKNCKLLVSSYVPD
ncbi:MAG: DUF2846 domain-containing protein [Bacteroidales bacterium]|nr:DUF2846 domain-containing protein [Bacteroidales bacterium]